MSKSYLDKAGVGTLSSLMKKEIKDTVESTKEQLFVVTVTPEGKPEEQANGDVLMRYTPSVTFAEAVAQAKSGKKVIIGPDGADLDIYVRMHLTSAGGDAGDVFFSEYETSFLHADTIKTFSPIMLQSFQWNSSSLLLIASQTLPKWIGDAKPTYTASEVGADESGAAVRASKDMQAWVIGEGYQTAAEVQAAIESAKEQPFVVTVTPEEEPPTEDEDSTTYSCTPSVTFEEAVAQVKSGKKVVIRVEHLGDFQMHYESSPNLLVSDDEFYLSYDKNIKTFHPFISQHFQWSKGGLILIAYNTLPKWIGDTKPTYTASEVGADASGAAAQALTDAKTWAGTELAKKEDKALYITETDITYTDGIGEITLSESYDTALAALKSGKRVFVNHNGKWVELYLYALEATDTIYGTYVFIDELMTETITWSEGTKATSQMYAPPSKPKRVSVTLTSSDWDTSKKTQTVTVMGVSADESAQVIQPIPALASRDGYNTFGIRAISQAKNSVTFAAGIIPASDLSVYIVITEVTA